MPTKKVTIDEEKCIGCNTCPMVAPDFFELDNTNFKAKVKKQPENPDDPLIAQVISSCPVGAISLVDSEN